MTTTNKSLEQPAADSTNWDVPLNANFGYIDSALGGRTTKSVTGVNETPVVLSLSEYRNLILNFTGTLSYNVTYQIPSGVGGEWVVSNNTTGSFTLTIGNVAGGASAVVSTGGKVSVYSDGTNVYQLGGTVGAAGNVAISDGSSLTGSTLLSYVDGTLKATADNATTDGVTASLRASHTTSGTAAAGIGAGVVFSTELPSGSEAIGAGIYAVLTDDTGGAEDYEMQFRLMVGGATSATIATITPTQLLIGSDPVVTARASTGTDAQSLAYAGITATASDDGTKSSGTYTPAPVGGNFKTIINGGAFTMAAPSEAGDYTLVVQITNTAGAGAITFSGFARVTGDAITVTSGHDFFVFLTKCNGFTSAVVQALQ